MGDQAVGGGGVEEVGAVLERSVEGVALAGADGEREVELGGRRLGGHAGEHEAGQAEGALACVLEREDDLEERGAAEIARGREGGDDALEGDVLVGVRGEALLAHAGDEVEEGGVAVDARAEDEGVDEEAGEGLDLRAAAPRDGGADDEVVLAGGAVEQRVEGREHGHEQRRALAAGEVAEGLREVGREGEAPAGAAEREDGRARAVGRQVERGGRAGELRLPEVELAVEGVAREPPALPDGEVAVLEGEVREGGGAAVVEGGVEGGDFADEDALRPGVGDDVVHRQEEDVLLGGEAEQARAEEGARGEVEGPGHLGGGGGLHGLLCLLAGGVLDVEREVGGFVDDLHGLAVDGGEGGAEHLVAADDLAEGPREGARVERAREPEARGDVVGGARGVELVEEPEPLQCERERHRAEAGGAGEGRGRGGGVALAEGGLDALGEAGDGGGLEDGAQGDLGLEGVAGAGDDLDGEEGVAAEVAEAIVHADAIPLEDVRPDGAEDLLDRRARGLVAIAFGGVGRIVAEREERLAVDLAVRGQRERVEQREGRGDHVIGQALLEVGAQVGGARGAGGDRDDVRDEEPAGRVLHGEDDRVLHAGAGGDRGLDLAELDAVAADLHLRVGAPEEDERAAVEPARAVARAVEAGAGDRGERVGDEALAGEIGLAQVAARDAGAADVDLAGHAGGRGLHGGVEHVDLRAGEGAAERDERGGQARAPRDGVRDDADGGLGGAVVVEDARRGREALQLLDELPARSLAAEDEEPARDHALGVRAREQRGEVRGDDLEAVDGVRLEVRAEAVGVGGQRLRDHVERAAQAEGREEDGVAEVGGEGRDMGVAGARGEGEALGHAADGVDEVPVLDGDGLGLAGRSGREEDVREVARRDAALDAGGALGGERGGVAVEADEGDAAGGEGGREEVVRDDDAGARALEQLGEALRGVRGVEREVGAAGLEDAEQADHEVDRSGGAEADDRLGADPAGAEVVRELVGAAVERAEGDLRVAGGDGDGVGGGVGLLLEELVEAGVGGVGGGGVVPRDEQAGALVVREHDEVGDLGLRACGDARKEGREVAEHPVDGARVEEIGVVLDGDAEAAVRRGAHHEGEVVLDGGALGPHTADLQAGQIRGLERPALHREDDLEEGRAARVRRGIDGLHEALEGHVLVRVGAEADLADALEEVGEGGVVGDLDAEHEGVDEEADEALGLGAAAAGDAGADHHVALARPAVEQHVEGGEQRHERRHALAPGERLEGLAHGGREDADALPAAERLHGGAGAVGREIDCLGAPASCFFQ